MSSTDVNLKEAFSGESQASRKYMAFAAKAEQEGYVQAARLFRAAAEAETVHASNHLKAMNAINTTKENLREAIAGETHEFKDMYPEMIEAAKADQNKAALRSFKFAMDVEESHAKLYHEMMENLDASKTKDVPYFVCPVCGLTVEANAPDVCPVCGAKGRMFKKIM